MYSIAKKTDSGMVPKSLVPGPGTHEPKYETNSMYKSFGNFKYGTEERNTLGQSSTSRIVPGPNAYNPNMSLVISQGAKFSIGGGVKGRPLTTSKF